MPRLLKKDSIRLAEASIESLALAQLGVSSFHRSEHKENIVRYAPETGLIGSSIELIMSSVLVQAYNKSIVIRNGLRYKTAVEILADFRALLRQRSTNVSFLVNGVNDSNGHLDLLLKLTERFRVIITARANALHNGIGLNFDVLSVLFQEVSSFISLIAKSNNYTPYINEIPKLIVLKKEKQLLIDEIYQSLSSERNQERQINHIASLFLLLPEIPNNLPDWLLNFERLNIAPREVDIVSLISNLERANPMTLRRVRQGGEMVPVRIDNTNPNAIPVQPQYLRGQFTQFRDQFFADCATANGRLTNGQLDLPPTISLCRLFCHGFSDFKILTQESPTLTPHQVWPNVAAAMKVASNSITFPSWYIIRKTEDLNQLRALLTQSMEYGNRPYSNNITEIIHGIDALINDQVIDTSRAFYSSSLIRFEQIKNNYDNFNLKSSKAEYDLSEIMANEVREFDEGNLSIYEMGRIIKENDELSYKCRRYWMTKIAKASYELESMPFLFSIYEDPEYNVCKTEIKKTLRSIDLITFGPKTIEDDA